MSIPFPLNLIARPFWRAAQAVGVATIPRQSAPRAIDSEKGAEQAPLALREAMSCDFQKSDECALLCPSKRGLFGKRQARGPALERVHPAPGLEAERAPEMVAQRQAIAAALAKAISVGGD